MLRHFSFALLAFSVCVPLEAQDLEDEFPPGLLARYSVGEATCERIDDSIAFVWNDESPDPRLPIGNFSASWKAFQLVRKNAKYTFHVYLSGTAELKIDGETVLSGESATPRWFSGQEIELSFGEVEFELEYKKLSDSAVLKLYLSSDYFPLEPVSEGLFFREEKHPEWSAIERGRRQFVAARCANCHESKLGLPMVKAPALDRINGSLSAEWIVRKLTDPAAAAPHGKMPRFEFSKEDARIVADYLIGGAEKPKLSKLPNSKEPAEDLATGKKLFHSRGCLACHRLGELGGEGEFAGPALDRIGEKRSSDWLFSWLTNPASLNRDHQMPVFDLKKDEQRQLTVYLASLGSGLKNSSDQNDKVSRRGLELIRKANCASCHRIPDIEPVKTGLPALAKLGDQAGCPNRRLSNSAPSYEHQKLDLEAIKKFISAYGSAPSSFNMADLGHQLLETKNCTSCHERGRHRGIVSVAGKVANSLESLRGESPALIPPVLTAVGDKLLDETLGKAISGKQNRRMDWLHVQMPKFEHSESEQSALLNYFVGADRMPGGVPDQRLFEIDSQETLDPQALLLSNTLVGPKGFSCVACHQVGKFVPRNVALGTRGSDLLNLGDRMRSSFFVRWMHSPIRIVPGMEMPSIGQKPVEHVLNGDIEQQLNVIWKGLNDKDFTVPTNPASVEQFWLVKPEGPARILRDVFSMPESAGGGYVARSFAVGFPNGHSVLFDLDRYEVRQWTVGDFAGQRTEGKSWYWDMAGVPVLNLPEDSSRFVLQWDNKTVPLELRESQAGELVSYRPEGKGVRLHFKLRFKSDAPTSEDRLVDLEEFWSPIDKMGMAGSGWRRSIHAKGVPAGAELVLQVPETIAQSFDIVYRTDGEENPSTEGHNHSFRKQLETDYLSRFSTQQLDVKENPPLISELDQLTTIPGFDAVRLPLDTKIMPTAFHWDQNGRLIFTSLEGHLFRATDSNEDGIEDSLQTIEEGLAAPYGVMPFRDGLLVAHKPELLLLKDTNGDGRADEREVFSSGWGYSDNYHDWTTGFAVDAEGNLFVGLGSDYAQPKRPADRARWRGSVLKISPAGEAEPFSFAFRYPTGIAFDSKGRLFATDNQGVQNTFNELNHLQEGRHYGVPARYETNRDAEETPPAIQIPHPWTRTINGIAFIPEDLPALKAFAGHGLGCELNSRLLIRFTLQEVSGVVQGATYYFSEPIEQSVRNNFLGPLSIGISNEGAIYVGSIQDAGWMGGQNIGTIARLKHSGQQPNGIRELTATPNGFRIECFHPVSKPIAETIDNYQISGYTRKWGGAYATPDSERHRGEITAVKLSKDGRTIDLSVEGLREGFVYEVTCSNLVPEGETFFPETGHYTLHKIPAE